MRLRAFALPVLLASVLLAPATASAAPTVGISDNRPQMFFDPNFTALGAKHARIVVSYDVIEASMRGDDELAVKVGPYLEAAGAFGIEPLVTFEHSRGAAEVCKSKSARRTQRVCYLPTVAEYEAALTAFLLRFPQVRVISPWNEVNHFTQGTSRSPKRAAQFTNSADRICKLLDRGCTIVVMDVLDEANNVRAKKPKYGRTVKYIKKFRKSLKVSRGICGIHNYSDVNRFRTTGTKALTKAMGCRSYWLTETGGMYDFGSFWSRDTKKAGKCRTARACQKKAVKFLFKKTLRVTSRIKRVYVYNWYGGNEPRFDAGIVEGVPGGPTKPRPAYKFVKKRI